MKIIIDSVKDHILSSISSPKKTLRRFLQLRILSKFNNTSRLITLKQYLLYMKMNNEESITSYFLRISGLKDQLATIGSQVDEKELSIIALKGLPLSWETFICGLRSQPDLSKFELLKNECTQEE